MKLINLAEKFQLRLTLGLNEVATNGSNLGKCRVEAFSV